MNFNIFRAYDIRGIADGHNPDITEDSIYLIGKAVGTYLIRQYGSKKIAVGRDNRLTGGVLQKAYVRGLLETGMDVTDVGIAISPMVYWSVCAGPEFDAASNLTASHNPKEYNGLKVVTNGAHSICGDELQEIVKIIKDKKFILADVHGAYEEADIWPDYLTDLCGRVKIRKPFKVVVDTGNGAAGAFAPEFLRAIGCEVVELYCDLDGNFPNHEANPEELSNMLDLISTVKEVGANLGIGFDGDGDRVGIVDETGHMYSSDFMLLLLVRDLLTRQKSPQIVFDVKVSQAIINDMTKRGAVPVMSKTGHSFIESRMKELGSPLGGEVSGHLFFGEDYYGFDDALLGAGKICQIVSFSDRPLSRFFDDLPRTYTTPEIKLKCPDDRKFRVVEDLVGHFQGLYECITIDGVRINFDEMSWGAVRASNTSPNLTLRFESDREERLNEIKEIMVRELEKYPEVDLANMS